MICLIACISACDDGVPEKLEIENFMMLYLSTASDDVKSITLPSTRDTSFVFGNVSYGGTTYYGQGNVVAEIGADFSLIEAYNTDNKTEFEPLPVECFAFDRTTLVIANGENYSTTARLFLVPGTLDTEKSYMLPVTIKSVSGDIPINEDKKTAYWTITFDDSAQPVVDFEKSTWEVISYSTQWNTTAASIIDGNIGTFWHTDAAGTMPQWVIIDMKATRRLKGFTLWHRQSGNSGDHGAEPKNIVFELSDDNSTWSTFIDVAELNNDYNSEIDIPASETQSGRYLRITVKTNWAGAGYTYFAEITPY